jgi:hypothetical protein
MTAKVVRGWLAGLGTMAVGMRYLILFPMLIAEPERLWHRVYHRHGIEEAEMTDLRLR